jgi:hypothetical protein
MQHGLILARLQGWWVSRVRNRTGNLLCLGVVDNSLCHSRDCTDLSCRSSV